MNISFSWTEVRNYLILLALFLAIDAVWLLGIAKGLYAKQLGYLMAAKPRLWAALLFYLLYVLGLSVFVLHPALAAGSGSVALLKGMLFGLVAYATYDLTNLATIRDWPVLVTALDLVWGAAVSGGSSALAYLIIRGM
ncbi:MAG: DUF2177 family protein [Eubacteriales bacterium]|nr:DUF2177 family protein [Eubacteriales bacterium]